MKKILSRNEFLKEKAGEVEVPDGGGGGVFYHCSVHNFKKFNKEKIYLTHEKEFAVDFVRNKGFNGITSDSKFWLYTLKENKKLKLFNIYDKKDLDLFIKEGPQFIDMYRCKVTKKYWIKNTSEKKSINAYNITGLKKGDKFLYNDNEFTFVKKNGNYIITDSSKLNIIYVEDNNSNYLNYELSVNLLSWLRDNFDGIIMVENNVDTFMIFDAADKFVITNKERVI